MKLYYTKGACSLACRIVINEIGINAEYISVDLKNKKTNDGHDFSAINPKGAVPTLVTDDGTVLTENAVIQQYLADLNHATNLLPEVGNIRRYKVLEWLNYIATEIHKGFSPFFNPAISNEIKEELFVPALKKKFHFIDKALENNSFLLGDSFTLGDCYLFVMLTWAKHFKFQLSDWQNITRYFNELKDRPSISKSLQEEGLSILLDQ